jgi:precorrin-6A/cobalt-precorrin-6A reductase
MPPKILILAGTQEARLLANKLVHEGNDVTSSFAGVTEDPNLPAGKIRRGGFGGVEGMRRYLTDEKIDLLIDATHPFATVISRHAVEAHSHVIRFERLAWIAQRDDRWTEVADINAAVAALPFEARVLLTIGRKEVAAFMSRPDLSGVARMIEEPRLPLGTQWTLILQRPPFTLESEIALMKEAEISHLVTKNAGGDQTDEKLMAARQLGLPVVIVARPPKPGALTFHSIDAIAAYVASR